MKRGLILLLLLCLLPVAAGAASFSITDYAMDITVEADGAGLFTETLTYAFDDEYNGILVTIRHAGGVGFFDLAIYEGERALDLVDRLDGVPYTYTAETKGERTDITVYAPGSGDTRTFTIAYRMGGLARRYRDAARINQVLFRAERDYKKAVFTLTLPGTDAAQVQPFVHGALYGSQIGSSNGKLTFGPSALEAGDIVEVQVLFPEGWIPEARTIDSDIVQDALAVEREIDEAAARKAAEEAALNRALTIGFTVGLGVYAIAFLLVFFAMRGRYGLKGPIASVTDEAMLSSIPAAMAQVLRDKAVSSAGLVATLMELAERGVLSMRSEKEDTGFTLTGDTDSPLPYQRQLVKWLFADGDTLWINSLDAGDDYKAAQKFTNHYNRFKSLVVEDVQDAGWTFKNGGMRFGLAGASLVLGLFLALMLIGLEASLLLSMLSALLGVLFCILFTRLRRLTDEGEARLGAINGFIENYRDKLEQDPRTVLGHAPLLMALGYLEPMAEWIDRHPNAGYDPYWDNTPVWIYAGWHQSMRHMDRTAREAQSHNARVQDPKVSDNSGSGGGGGFSGGSGGGSSHGAW